MSKIAKSKITYTCNTVLDHKRQRKDLEWIVLKDGHPLGKYQTRREARAAVREAKIEEARRGLPT
jgi:hypothetical protein